MTASSGVLGTPVMVSIRPGGDVRTARRALDVLPFAPRVRVVGVEADLRPWIELFAGHRLSIDVAPDELVHVDLADPAVRQVRVALPEPSLDEALALQSRCRSDGPTLSVVLQVPAQVLEADPGPWQRLFEDDDKIFVNIVRPSAPLDADTAVRGLQAWDRALGDRVFHSLPPIGAAALGRGAACPAALGMHAYLDFADGSASTCDCQALRWEIDGGDWLERWRSEVALASAASAAACDGCRLFDLCRSGCPASIGDRDLLCPWPDERFVAADGGSR